MTAGFARYGVYWVPQSGSRLAKFGVTWTGWCAEAGEPRDATLLAKIDPAIRSQTKELRRHGFHAELKPLFRLASGRSVWPLETALERTAEACRITVVPRMQLAVVKGRLSLTPADGDSELDRLTIRLRRALEPIVEPASKDTSSLSVLDRPRALETAVGAIPILSGPCFHIPLSDTLSEQYASRFAAEIAPLILPLLDTPQIISDLALVGDPGFGRPVRILRRLAFREEPVRPLVSALAASGPKLYSPLRDRSI